MRLVDTPQLARVVPLLPAETLHQLIRHCGLEACGEIVASATPAQLATVFDLDLWRSAQPGHDERFDVERFGEWLELLADAGGDGAARIIAAMDDQLLTAGLSRHIRVFDLAAIDFDVAAYGGLECELGGYRVCAIRPDAWDAIVALLLALAAEHDDRFHAVMRECRRVSNSSPEIDGLDDLLMQPEQLLHDVALDREDRRSQQGYSTPADARAFLLMARQRRQRPAGEPPVNPIVAAYFRSADDTVASGDACAPDTLAPDAFDLARARAVIDALTTAGVVPQRPRALLEGTHSQPERCARIRALMQYVHDNDDSVYVTRSRELAFLANTLMAGCSIQSRSFTAQEASDAAVAVCNLGLDHSPADVPDSFLIDHDLVSAFEEGWVVLYKDVSMFVAEQLLVALSSVQCTDADIEKEIGILRRELRTQCQAGTPWRAHTALDVIAMLDTPAWVSVLGLLDEYPVIPAALTATLEGRTGAISPTEFEFISTRSQLRCVRDFMDRFLDIVSRA